MESRGNTLSQFVVGPLVTGSDLPLAESSMFCIFSRNIVRVAGPNSELAVLRATLGPRLPLDHGPKPLAYLSACITQCVHHRR